MPDRQHNSARWLVTAAVLATLAVAAALTRGWEPGIPGEWIWRQNRLPVSLWPAITAGLLVFLLARLVCRPGRWGRMSPISRATVLVLLVVIVLALQWSLLTAVGPPSISWIGPGWIIASPNATTYFSASMNVKNVGDWLRFYPEQMWRLPHHARTHPPGFILFFMVVRRLCSAVIPEPGQMLETVADTYNRTFGTLFSPTDAAAAIAGAAGIALVGALSLIPLYLLGRELVGPEAAVCATCLAAALPALLLLAASPDQIILALAITVIWLSYSAWRRGSVLRAFLAGVIAALGLFFSLAFTVVGAWLLVWLAIGLLRSHDRRLAARRALGVAIIVLAGFALFHLALYLACGYRPLAVAHEALIAHQEVTTVAFPRTYWKWVLMDPVELALFAGLPLVISALWVAKALGRDGRLARLRPLLISWLIVLVVLNLSGTVRGEVGRIWLFLSWPAALAAGAGLAGRRYQAAVPAFLVVLQLAQALAMRHYLTIYSIL